MPTHSGSVRRTISRNSVAFSRSWFSMARRTPVSRRRGSAALTTPTTSSIVGSWPGPSITKRRIGEWKNTARSRKRSSRSAVRPRAPTSMRHGHLGRERAQVAPLAVAEGVEREVVGDLDAADAGRGGAAHEVRGGQGLRRLLSRNADRPRVGVAAEAQPHRTLLLALSSRTARKMTQAITSG